ncbi:hypothetical protein M409DRAFT_17652 [Zasmidium cellare ATCC 36951]|uniref:SMP-30/Gluconolactonase/LRE-like region domain-containing protein n=1 Tax=Zasmidium cellare ATCC 36951 TaxID=1080233 RepID=A0A6A6D2S9_ZASCE|nr:uncharacterized protein M409DRAFT_17652 [Zasmidium cellare ATCC 36951]KAF2172419.1 hypothetical protein M409DRAFT_17652 [Zasmidium cellare ATCC 36951]
MASAFLKYGTILALAVAVFYQLTLKNLIFTIIGVGRHVQPISDFPYQCRRIHDERLQACEDMWLSEETRQLFLACSDPLARQQWDFSFSRFNISGRSRTDAVIALDIDKPKGDSFDYRVLKTPSYKTGDGHLYLVGLTGRDNIPAANDPNKPPFSIDIALVNGRPPRDSQTGEFLDASELGGDFTIELFETDAHATELRHKETYHHPEIKTPNNVAFAPTNGFYITNDHGTAKAGLKFTLAPFLHNGDVTYCTHTNTCKTVSTSHAFPNGLHFSPRHGHLFVPSAHSGGITIYAPNAHTNDLQKISSIDIPYPIDNLSEDRDGDIWVPAFPKGLEMLQAYADPLGSTAATTVFRVRKSKEEGDGKGWEVEKMLEDRHGEVLPGATSVVHDARTGRVFLAGVVAPFVTVCEPVGK